MKPFSSKSEAIVSLLGITVCFLLGLSECKHSPKRVCEDRRVGGGCSSELGTTTSFSSSSSFPLTSSAPTTEEEVTTASYFPSTTTTITTTATTTTFTTPYSTTIKPLDLPAPTNATSVRAKLASTTLFSKTTTSERPTEKATTTAFTSTSSDSENLSLEQEHILEGELRPSLSALENVEGDSVNDVFIKKENLFHPPAPYEETKPENAKDEDEDQEYVCTFADELHEYGTTPICPLPRFTVEETDEIPDNNAEEIRRKRSVLGQRTPLTSEEMEQLQKLYGNRFDLEAAERLKSMGESIEEENYPYAWKFAKQLSQAQARRHPRLNQRPFYHQPGERYPHKLKQNNHVRKRRQGLGERLLRQINAEVHGYRTEPKTELIKLLLEELKKEEKAEKAEGKSPGSDPEPSETSGFENECSLYGTWLSPLAGVAIELRPVEGSVRVLLEDLPFAKQRLITSSWVGDVMISPVIPTTLTLLLQEGKESIQQGQESPGTAVFTGQCVSCKGGAAIQGTWVIFSRHPECSPGMRFSNDSVPFGRF